MVSVSVIGSGEWDKSEFEVECPCFLRGLAVSIAQGRRLESFLATPLEIVHHYYGFVLLSRIDGDAPLSLSISGVMDGSRAG